MWADVICTALLHTSWQFALIGLTVYLVLQIIPDRKAQPRYLAACAGSTACLLAFLATLFWTGANQIAPSISDSFAAKSEFDLATMLVLLWLGGSGVMGLRYSLSFLNVQRLKASESMHVPREILIGFKTLARHMGVKESHLMLSEAIHTPCTFGTLKPIVLLPASLMTKMSPDEINAILAHELAHIRRYDYLVNMVQQAIFSLFYYHPAIHFINRQIDREREIACDDLALTITGNPRELASALGKITLFAQNAPHLSVSALGCRNDVAARMIRLVNPTGSLQTGRRFVKLFSTVVVAVSVLMCANLAVAFASGWPDVKLTTTQIAQLRDDICNQVKNDGYYGQPEFQKSKMVRVDLHADNITLNGISVTQEQLPAYTSIVSKYGLKRGEGRYIYFNSRGNEIQLGRGVKHTDGFPKS